MTPSLSRAIELPTTFVTDTTRALQRRASRKAAFLRLADIPLRLDHFRLDGDAANRADFGTESRDGHHLALAQQQDFLGVRNHRGDIRGDEPFLVPDAHHERRIEPGADQKIRILLRKNRHGVGSPKPAERLPYRRDKVALVELLDQL